MSNIRNEMLPKSELNQLSLCDDNFFKQLSCKSDVFPRIARLILDEDRIGVHPSLDRDSPEFMRFWLPPDLTATEGCDLH
jgi:hypothetical protein